MYADLYVSQLYLIEILEIIEIPIPTTGFNNNYWELEKLEITYRLVVRHCAKSSFAVFLIFFQFCICPVHLLIKIDRCKCCSSKQN